MHLSVGLMSVHVSWVYSCTCFISVQLFADCLCVHYFLIASVHLLSHLSIRLLAGFLCLNHCIELVCILLCVVFSGCSFVCVEFVTCLLKWLVFNCLSQFDQVCLLDD